MTASMEAVLTAVRDRIAADVQIRDASVQLDPFDVDAFIANTSFRGVGVAVVFGSAKPDMRATGAMDLAMGFGIFIAATRTGRSSTGKAGADMEALNKATKICASIAREPYCGLGGISPVKIEQMHVLASELTNNAGFALVAIELSVTLYDVLAVATANMPALAVTETNWNSLSLNGGDPAPLPGGTP